MENKVKAVVLASIAVGCWAWFISQTELSQPQEGDISEHFIKPNKRLLLNDGETKDVISFGEITLHESTNLRTKGHDVEPLNIDSELVSSASTKGFKQPNRLVARRATQRDQLSDQYGFQFLPESIFGNADAESILRSSRRFIERQLSIKSDDAQLVELAQQAGVNDALIQKFKAQSIHLDARRHASRGSSLPATSPVKLQGKLPQHMIDGRRSTHAHQQHLLEQQSSLNQNQALKLANITQDGARPFHQGRGNEQKQVIAPAVESLRRSLIANTSNSLAKLQLKELGLSN